MINCKINKQLSFFHENSFSNAIKIVVVILLFQLTACQKESEIPYLVVFSLDGFRHDYADACKTPTLDSIEKFGVKAESLIPSFPTITFPNHYTLATGLYPGNHGIVHNTFFDKKLQRTYKMIDHTAVSDSIFYGGIPIWNLLQMRDIKTATCFWVGSEAPVNSMYANYWMKYDWKLPYNSRIDTVINWLKKPEKDRPHFIMAYFSEPDHSGHKFGPLSPGTNAKVEMLDSVLAYFFAELKKLPLQKQVNVIVLSDHGMARVDSATNIFMYKYIKESWIKRINCYSSVAYIEPVEMVEDSVSRALSAVEHLRLFKREELPEEWHLADTNRVDKFVAVADNGYMLRGKDDDYFTGGMHGYDNKAKDMETIFYAIGSAFKVNYTQPSFNNVDIYPLYQEVFNLENIENRDGLAEHIIQMLSKNK